MLTLWCVDTDSFDHAEIMVCRQLSNLCDMVCLIVSLQNGVSVASNKITSKVRAGFIVSLGMCDTSQNINIYTTIEYCDVVLFSC